MTAQLLVSVPAVTESRGMPTNQMDMRTVYYQTQGRTSPIVTKPHPHGVFSMLRTSQRALELVATKNGQTVFRFGIVRR
jgi:hypothetical protein